MSFEEWIKIAVLPVSVASAVVAWTAAKRAASCTLDISVSQMNTSIAGSDVLGPIVLAAFPEKKSEEQIAIQKKIVVLLNMVNYFSSCWNARYHKLFGGIPFQLMTKKDWHQRLAWFEQVVWPWIRNDPDLLRANQHLIKTNDFQYPGFAEFYTRHLKALEAGPGDTQILKQTSGLRLLRLFLFFSALAWGVSFVGVVVPWPTAVEILQGLGVTSVPFDPMLDYWLRMASGAFALVGGIFLVLALRPARYSRIIPWFGALMLLEGIILLVHGLRLGLRPLPFYADTAVCFTAGIGILALAKAATEAKPVD